MRAIRDDGLGGVILFDRDHLTGGRRNITSRAQLTDLVATLREAARPRRLIVAVDQEGGRVSRLNAGDGFTTPPSEASIGRSDDPAEARQIARRTATTLAGVGIDFNLAPVVDLNVNPSNPSIGALGRSFSPDPDVVVSLATAMIRGHHDEKVLTAIKHFPGLGSATGDTDVDIVDISKTWSRAELEPFRRLAASGLPDAVMVGNALNTQLDRRNPSTLSSATVGLLREQLGWDGVVITDDLQAGAIRKSFSDDETVRLALAAGEDLLLYANQQVYVADLAKRTIDRVVKLVGAGAISEERLQASAARVAAMLS